MKNRVKAWIRKTAGVTYIEVMIAMSILAISMTYLAYDSRFSAKAIHELNEMDRMLYSAQASIERYKLEQSGGTRIENGYTVDIEVIDDPAQDPNLTTDLKKVILTVHPKDTSSAIGDLVMVSYVYSNVTQPPSTPQGLVATAAVGGITLNWDASLYADSYSIYKSEVSGASYSLIADSVGTNMYTDTSTVPGTTYYYVVKAVNSYGESDYSNEASATIIVNLTSANLLGDAYVRGGSFAGSNYGANQALFFREHNNTRHKYKSYLKFDVSAVSGTITQARLRIYGYNSSGGTMGVNIHRVDGDSWSEMGITWSNAPAEGDVIATTTLDNTRKYVEVDVTAFCAEQLEGDKTAGFALTTTSGSLGDVNSREAANPPQLDIAWTPLPPPPAPQNLKAVPGDGKVILNWDTVVGAESYSLKRGTNSGGPYAAIQTGLNTTGFTDTGVTNGTTYYYVVTALSSTGESSNSNEDSATPNPVTTVTYNPEADAYVKDGAFSSMNYGTLEKLEVKNSPTGSDEKRMAYLRFNLTNLGGEIIDAKLRVFGSNIEDSMPVTVGFYDVEDSTWQENTITFTGKPVPGTEIGSIQVSSMSTYRDLDITSYLESQVSGDRIASIAAAGKDYNKLLSFNSRENPINKPELVITKTLSAPATPENLTAVPDDGRVDLSWTIPAEAESYNVKRSTTDGGPYTTIAPGVTAASYTDSLVTNGTTYYYVVSAVNASGESGDSNQDSATPNTTITRTFNPTADARVESLHPSSNYGSDAALSAANSGSDNKKSYLRFDLSGYTHNSVVSARLRLYGRSSSGSLQIDAHGVSDDAWVESGAGGITWNNAPPLESGTGSVVFGTTQQYYEIDVTSFVSARADVSNLVSVGLFTDTVSGSSVTVNSREAAAGKPELVVKMVEGAPKPPTNLIAIAGDKLADLRWNASVGALSYTVRRSDTSGGPYTTIAAGISATTYRDTGVKNGRGYYYVVYAINAKGESGESNEACAIPDKNASSRTILPDGDTYVRNGAFSDSNFGGDTVLNISSSSTLNDGNTRHGYIRFNLLDLQNNPVNATLMITGKNITNNKKTIINIYKVTNDSWNQYGMSWNNAPGNDILIGSVSVNHKYNTKTLNITNYVKTELAGDKMLSICLKPAIDDRIISFSSSEGTDPPLLQVTY